MKIPIQNRSNDILAYFVVDDIDYEWAKSLKWHFSEGYPATGAKSQRLHTLMFQYDTPSYEVDHIDGDKLNNSRSNLRVVPLEWNRQNVHTKKGEYRGIYLDKRDNMYYGQVKHKGRKYSTTRHKSKEEVFAFN
jgi:hypothetical protein